MEKIVLLRVDGDSLATIEQRVTTEQADRIAVELLDAHADTGEEVLLVRARRSKVALVDVVVPAQVVAGIVAGLNAKWVL